MACFRSLSNCFLLALGLMVWAAGPAWAAIDKAGAQKLKTVMDKAVTDWQAYAAAYEMTLELDGPVMVEPNGTYYAVTLPGLKIGDMDGARVEMGMVAINAMPAAKPGQWKMTVALPTPISRFDENHKLETLVTIGAQNLAGIWDEDLSSFAKINATYSQIVAMTPDRKPFLTIANTTLDGDLEKNAKGLWSGPARITLNNLALQDPNGTKGSAGSLTFVYKVKDYAPAATRAYGTKMEALNESIAAGDGKTVSADHLRGMLALLGELMETESDAVSFSFTLKDAALSASAPQKAPARQVAVESLQAGMDFNNFHSPHPGMRLWTDYEGLRLTAPAQNTQSIPKTARMDISIDKIPFKALLGLAQQSLQMAGTNAQMGNIALLNGLMTAPKLLAEAGTTLTVKDSHIRHPDYDVTIDATAIADIKALLSATGAGTVKVRGLDKLIAETKNRASLPNQSAQMKNTGQKLLKNLTLMQIVGTKEKGAAGEDLHVYRFTLGQDGKMMLNGSDLSVLLQQ